MSDRIDLTEPTQRAAAATVLLALETLGMSGALAAFLLADNPSFPISARDRSALEAAGITQNGVMHDLTRQVILELE